MGMKLEQCITDELCRIAKQHQIEKLVLFGSRARGSSHDQSDIDLAVWGIRNAAAYLDFQEDIESQVPTLLRFDLADMDNGLGVSDALRAEIAKDGVILYEKI